MRRLVTCKRIASLLVLSMILCVFTTVALAYAYFTYDETDTEATVKNYSGDETNVSIPDTYNGKPVTGIGSMAFRDCDTIKSITLPGSIKTIGADAFDDCNSLANIPIPANVTTIEDYAFDSCTSLESITIPDTVTSFGNMAFWGCSKLKNVTLPKGLTVLTGTFDYCSSLPGVTLPNTVTFLNGTFNGCESLASIALPKSVVFIGADTFLNCKRLSAITIPDNVQSIGSSAFRLCTSLQTVAIPHIVRDIGANAFESCTSLKNVTISGSVTNIGNAAFINCTNLTRAVFQGDKPAFGNSYVFSNAAQNFKVYYPVSHMASWSGYYDFTKQAYCMAAIYPNNGSPSYQVMADVNNGHIAVPAAPVYANHIFKGWFKDAALQKPWNFGTDTISADVSLFAKWTANTCIVTFSSQGGTSVAAKTVTYNSLLTAPAPPTRTGYVFMGWYKETACAKPWNFATDKVTSNITLYAKWESTIPTGVKAVSGSYNSVIVNWNAVAKAGGYEIFRSSTKTGTYSSVGTAATTHFTATGLITGKTYYYKVKSYTYVGTKKTYSNFSSIAIATPIPATPAAKAVHAGAGSIKVTWGAVAGATKYLVMRSTSATGTYALVKTTTTLSFTNTGLITGKTYYYKVLAYHLEGTVKVYSLPSAVVFAKA